MADMNAYALRLQEEAERASRRAVEYLRAQTVARARASEDWAMLADNIEVWSQDGRLVVGIRDNELASQAFSIEYGDEVHPPNPLFRTMSGDLNIAQQIVDEHMTGTMGPGRFV